MSELETKNTEAFGHKKISRRAFLREGTILGLALGTVGCDLMTKVPEPGKTPGPKPNTGGGDGSLRLPETATTTSTATAEPTKVPPTATEVAKKVEKSPLPIYGVYRGNFPDGKGSIVVASIPEKSGNDQILVYVVEVPGGGAMRSDGIYMDKPTNIQGNSFHADRAPGTLIRLQADYNPTSNVVSGKFEYGRPGQKQEFESPFEAKFDGNGNQTVINAIKQAKVDGMNLGYVPDLSVVNIDYLKKIVDLDKLPK